MILCNQRQHQLKLFQVIEGRLPPFYLIENINFPLSCNQKFSFMLSWQKTPALYYRLLSGQISSGAEEVVWSYNGRFILNDVIATSSTCFYIKLLSGQMSVDQSDAFLVAIELDRSFFFRDIIAFFCIVYDDLQTENLKSRIRHKFSNLAQEG